MKLHILDMPEQPVALAEWLEQLLIGEQLGVVVAELKALIGEPLEVTVHVESVVGKSLDRILEQGLKHVGPAVLNRLIAHPSSLVDLQDQVFMRGGDYWQARIREIPVNVPGSVDRWVAIKRAMNDAQPAVVPLSRQPVSHKMPTWLFALAASVLGLLVGAFAVRQSSPPTAVAWGWNNPQLVNRDLSAREYLRSLATAGEAWTKQRPTTTREIAQRLGELRQGCTKLILADHPPLTDEDRQWLVGKCREWAGKFDQQLVALEALRPHEDPVAVRNEVDAIVAKLAKALRDRAESIGAG